MGILNEILTEVGEEMGRMATQGRAELAAALFNNSDAFVQYGAGQNPVEVERAQEAPAVEPQAQIEEQSRGMEM